MESETRETITQITAELAERREAVIAAVKAEYGQMEQREFALLREFEALKRERVQRARMG